MRILIVGHGEMGRSFETVLKGHAEIDVWDKNLDTGEENQPLETAASKAELVIFTVPATPHAELAERVCVSLPTESLVLSIAKGIAPDGRHPLQILVDVFGKERAGGAYGPTIGEELQEGRPGFAELCAFSAEYRQRVLKVFENTQFYLTSSTDPWGAAWSAVLKNVYVPLIGAAEALDFGDNVLGLLAVKILDEMRLLGAQLGGSGEPLTGLAAVGDLFTTATSAGSHHRAAGAALARGRREEAGITGKNIRGEGFNTLRILQHSGLDIANLPLFELARVLLGEADAFPGKLQSWLEAQRSRV